MHIIVLGTLFPNENSINEFLKFTKGGIPSTGSEVQASIIRGLDNFCEHPITIINAEPIGTWPNNYEKLKLQNKLDSLIHEHDTHTVGCVNLPVIKQISRYIRTYYLLKETIRKIGPDEQIEILMYHFYLPHMRAALKLKKSGNIKLNIIVPDLPNEYGIGYNCRNPFIRFLRYRHGRKELSLAKKMDRYILFTKYMKKPLEIGNKPYIVMEGICSKKYFEKYSEYTNQMKTTFLYSGNISAECGVFELLDAFSKLNQTNAELHLYGFGSGVGLCKQYARSHNNIFYHEPVSIEELCKAQQQATYLINPRKNEGNAVKYFFPSKTFGYMASGRPMIAYWLDCFPEEYKGLFYEIDPNDTRGLEKAINRALMTCEDERKCMGERAREFVISEKNERTQAYRIFQLIKNEADPNRSK